MLSITTRLTHMSYVILLQTVRCVIFFLFSSSRRHTRFSRDWSSDVCSSDLGQREAELIFGAIRASVLLEPAPALCFDLGGGSLEVMVGDAGGLLWATSENLGVGRLTAAFVDSDPVSKDDRRRLRAHLVDVLTPVADRVATFGPKLFVVSSGPLEELAHMDAA